MVDTKLGIGIVGASGRMGQRLMQVIAQSSDLCLAAVLLHKRPVALPEKATTIATGDKDAFVSACDVVIDFSAPAAVETVLPLCVKKQKPYLVASTALSDAQTASIDKAARDLPVLFAANLSVGIAALAAIIKQAAQRLHDFDVEIVETHHRHKRDAPSGTALYLFEQARAAKSSLHAAAGRAGKEALRQTDDVGLHAIRGGDVAGEHHVMFLGDGERLELSHRSHDGFVFARGAVRAAKWLVQQPPGLYDMQDMLAGRP